MSFPTERLRFPSTEGNMLAGQLEQPRGDTLCYAILAHCFTCSKDLKSLRRISRALAESGIAVLRFDFTGIGESEGDFADTDFSSNLDDLLAAAEFLRIRYAAPQLLIGHSLGGAAVLAVGGRIPEVHAVATIAAPSDTQHLRSLLVRKAPELASSTEAEVELGGRRFRIKRSLFEDLEKCSVIDAAAKLARPPLVFHSAADQVVPVEHGHRIFQAAQHSKSFVSLDQADHLLLSREQDAAYVGRMLANWVVNYLQEHSRDD